MVRGVFLFMAAGLLAVGLAATGHIVGALWFPTAFAQTEVILAQPASWADTIWTQVQPAVITAATAIISALAIWIGTKIATFLGVKNEETTRKIQGVVRELAHAVAWNAIKYAAAKSDNKIMDQLAADLPPPQDLLDIAKKYFHEMNPDLAETISESELEKILTSKLPDLINLVKPKSTTIVNSDPSK